MAAQEVKKRCVFFLGGYEPIPPERQHERFIRELARFQQTWQVTSTISDLTLAEGGAIGSWRVETKGPNWAVDTEYRSLLWGDLVASDFGRSDWERVPCAIRGFADFIGSGAAFRYFAVNWRYGLFFLYPILILLGFVAIGLMLAWHTTFYGLPPLLVPLAALVVFALLTVWPGRFLLLPYMLDDWLFAYELVHRSRPGLDERLDLFAKDLADRLRTGSVDEIVFSGHSLGCALKVEVLDRALRMVPEFGSRGEQLSVLSTGSSLLKIALHPAAGWLKEAVQRVSQNNAVFWAEYQTMVDIISFYKVNSLQALGLPDTGRPTIRRVHVRDMLLPETYRRFKGNFFRLHRQLVMGNDKRYFYDYFMVCCGPFRLITRADHPERVTAFSANGALEGEFMPGNINNKADAS
jgi:hypothetical protein